MPSKKMIFSKITFLLACLILPELTQAKTSPSPELFKDTDLAKVATLQGTYEVKSNTCQTDVSHANIFIDFQRSDIFSILLFNPQDGTSIASVGDFTLDSLRAKRAIYKDGVYQWLPPGSNNSWESLEVMSDGLIYRSQNRSQNKLQDCEISLHAIN